MKKVKTNAMRLLDQHKIDYIEHEYAHKKEDPVDGIFVAAQLKEPAESVYKTLVAQGKSKTYYVFMLPVAEELDLKKCALAVGEKSIELIPQKDLLKISGYIRGGCSPLGMKKVFKTTIQEACLEHDTIYFSGGKIGLQIEMDPKKLRDLLPIQYKDIVRK